MYIFSGEGVVLGNSTSYTERRGKSPVGRIVRHLINTYQVLPGAGDILYQMGLLEANLRGRDYLTPVDVLFFVGMFGHNDNIYNVVIYFDAFFQPVTSEVRTRHKGTHLEVYQTWDPPKGLSRLYRECRHDVSLIEMLCKGFFTEAVQVRKREVEEMERMYEMV